MAIVLHMGDSMTFYFIGIIILKSSQFSHHMKIPDKTPEIGIRLHLESRVHHLTKGGDGGGNISLAEIEQSQHFPRDFYNSIQIEITTKLWLIVGQFGVWRRI